jgi:hypothetical protein
MAAKKGLYYGASKSGGKRSGPSGKKKTRNATSSLKTLQKLKESSRAEHGRPKKTRDNYAGYVERGKSFLEGLVAERRENVNHINDNLDDDIDIDSDMLEKSFDNPPNKYTVWCSSCTWFRSASQKTKGKVLQLGSKEHLLIIGTTCELRN